MSFRGGMPRPLPRVPHVQSPFLLRAELLSLVPFSMASIDRLEGKGQFPKRIRLEPTNRVAWLRCEVKAYLRRLGKRSQSAVQEDNSPATHGGFDPVPGQLFCKCGVELSRFSLRCHSDNSGVISCRACEAELLRINFNVPRRS
jgi:predicted DNA-binding transcriptional regulator AlpA